MHNRHIVIGSEGFIGKALVKFLKNKYLEVITIDIKKSDAEDARICDLNLLSDDVVYFLAWNVGGSKYLYNADSQISQLEWNTDLLRNILTQILSANCRLLFTSSQLVKNVDIAYGVTKKLGEVWTSLMGGSSVRFFNVYGSYEHPNDRSHVIGDFIHEALHTNEINMMTNGLEQRQFIFIDDICEAIWLAINTGEPGSIYDVRNDEWVSILDVANIISRLTGAIVNHGKTEGQGFNPGYKDIVPGWSAKINLETGIKKTIECYKNNF